MQLFANVDNFGMKTEEQFYYIFMYWYNKNSSEYAQIARSGPKSMILNIEGCSSIDWQYMDDDHTTTICIINEII